MKVICIRTGGTPKITIGKIYQVKVYNLDNRYIGLIDDSGEFKNLRKDKFKPLDEFRSDQIEKVLL
jgi:hypothetical protein